MGGLVTTFAITPSVGDHIVRKVLGLSVDVDTVWATGAALVLVLVLSIYLRRRLTNGVPGKLQTVWELGLTVITDQVEGTVGPAGRAIVPLAFSLFVFILFCNFFEFLGIGSHFEWLPAPTGDINLPLAMALLVIVLVHIASLRARGIVGYFRHYAAGPFPIVLLPANLFINILEEIAKPLTLTLRLFGNLLSGALMLSLIAYMGVQWKIGAVPVGNVLVIPVEAIWKSFSLFIGLIQAFIFALLTILYFDAAMSSEH